MVEVLSSKKLATVVTYGAVKNNLEEEVLFGVLDIRSIPDVGDFGHWNIKQVQPCMVGEDGKYRDIRTGKMVKLQKNNLVWPLFTGNVLVYPDGKSYLLSRRFHDNAVLQIDITGQERPANTRVLTVK